MIIKAKNKFFGDLLLQENEKNKKKMFFKDNRIRPSASKSINQVKKGLFTTGYNGSSPCKKMKVNF